MTQVDFEAKSVEDIQKIARRKHILITQMHDPGVQFDAKGLSSLTTLSTVTDIQGKLAIPKCLHFSAHRKG
jgi:hypothetical protein